MRVLHWRHPAVEMRSSAADSADASAFVDLIGQYIGTYKITAHLGSGGTGDVYRAEDTTLPRSVAIKVLSNKLSDANARTRFQNEARSVSSLNHPHILTVHGAGEFEGRQYLVTEFVDGGTLRDWIKAEAADGGRLSNYSSVSPMVSHQRTRSASSTVTSNRKTFLLLATDTPNSPTSVWRSYPKKPPPKP
jgi:hypothetical protein